MTQHVRNPTEEKQQFPQKPAQRRFFTVPKSIIAFLAIIVLLLILFTGLLLHSMSELAGTSSAQANPTTPLLAPGEKALGALQLPEGQEIIYAQQDALYAVSSNGGPVRQLNTPGYVYNRAVPPLITSAGELLYSGAGIWLADIHSDSARQIATLPDQSVITALALSQDAQKLAWSSMPTNGNGNISIYAGPVDATSLIYHQQSQPCPCLRVFGFLTGTDIQADSTLLLTNDRGDQRAVRYGLWTFDLLHASTAQPQQLLSEDLQQGPLALSPQDNTLLYSSYEGFVPAPTDGSAPTDIGSLAYANSLSLSALNPATLSLEKAHVLLTEQHELKNSTAYHWVTTPQFSSDGHTLVYVEFASDVHDPFARHSALYAVHISGSGTQLQTSKPQLLATANAHYLELGKWLDGHTLSFYADGGLYALNVQQGTFTQIAQIGGYAQVLAMVPQNHE